MADTEPNIEINEADALEQRQDVTGVGLVHPSATSEADPADVADQQMPVDLDEDEYR